jgi:hypothetical protein
MRIGYKSNSLWRDVVHGVPVFLWEISMHTENKSNSSWKKTFPNSLSSDGITIPHGHVAQREHGRRV